MLATLFLFSEFLFDTGPPTAGGNSILWGPFRAKGRSRNSPSSPTKNVGLEDGPWCKSDKLQSEQHHRHRIPLPPTSGSRRMIKCNQGLIETVVIVELTIDTGKHVTNRAGLLDRPNFLRLATVWM